MPDGRRILGDGKTYGGFFTGVLFGLLVGIVQTWASVFGWRLWGIQFPLFETAPPVTGIGF